MTQGWNDAIPGIASLGYYSPDKVDPTIMGRCALPGRNIRPMMMDSVRRIIIAIIIIVSVTCVAYDVTDEHVGSINLQSSRGHKIVYGRASYV